MPVLDSIIAEEFDRLESLRKRMIAEIASCPQGAFSVKRKGARHYAYRAYRKSGKVVTDYIGPADSEEAVTLASLIHKRQTLSSELKAVSQDINRIRRILHVR